MKNRNLIIIAGPCSIDKKNIKEIFRIAKIRINGKPAIWGTRIVGLKSRTYFNQSGLGMGIDHHVFLKNLKAILNKKILSKLSLPESVKIAQRIVKETHLIIASEIVEPIVQLIHYEKKIFKNRLLIWNPAVNQLGWPILTMSYFAKKNGWWLGIKNPKWVGENLRKANSSKYESSTTMEKTWQGLVDYADYREKTVLIHRGVDAPEKKNYRNAPVHNIAKRVKQRTGCLLFFDPSHSYGPQMREEIVPATIEAMKMMISKNEFLYDGILIEVGTSKTDTEQHISIREFKSLIEEISKFRFLFSGY